MRERPTPETDAAERMAFAQEYMVPTDFARRLERERDEALKLFESSKRAQASLSKACDSLQKELRETIRERDNLQEIIRGEWPEDQAEYLIRYAKEAAK